MAQKLSCGNGELALLGNTLPTGAILVVLILIFGPVSGAHFNPAVNAGVRTAPRAAVAQTRLLYIAVQIVWRRWLGVWVAHLMFELPVWQIVATVRRRRGANGWPKTSRPSDWC